MKILERYILKEAFKPFILSLIIVTFVFLIDKIIDLLNLIIEKRLDIPAIISVFSLSLPFIVALSVPMAVLVATIITFGRLSVDNELVAFKSCGINIYTLMRSTVLSAIIISLGMIYFNNYILPETNFKLKNLLVRLHQRRPVASIRPGTFTNIKNYTIFAFDVSEDVLQGVTIYEKKDVPFPTTITAERGEITLKDGGNNFKAVLYNGQVHERNKTDPRRYSLSNFSQLTLHLPDLGYQMNIEDSQHRGDREKPTDQMISDNRQRRKEIGEIREEISYLQQRNQEIKDMRLIPPHLQREVDRNNNLKVMARSKIDDLERRIRQYEVEIHKKYAIAVACLIFVVLGVPIGMMIKSSGVGVAFTVSTFIFITYYICLVMGEHLGDQGHIPPFLGMWTPNFLFGSLGIYLVIKSTKDTTTINITGLLKKLAKKKSKIED